MFVIIWEFQPRPGLEAEFERAYGPDGEWARLFNKGDGYLGTELLKAAGGERRYLTLDRWRSREDFETFEAAHPDDYAALDRRCETLTAKELLIGRFGALDE